MFELASPWALMMLLAPVIYWVLVPRAQDGLPAALKIPFFHAMVNVVSQEKRTISLSTLVVLPAFIWILTVIALAGPRWVGEPKPLEREGYHIMMALDLSGSMEIRDMFINGHPVDRLFVVKEAARQFVLARTTDKIGLILFGTRAYLQTPLTYDKHAILLRIEDASAGLAGQTTSIGDALGLAVKHLIAVPKQGRIIILLTDGANNSGVLAPLKAAELAKDEGIKVYTIGLGSDESANEFFATHTTADLDEGTLKQIADTTGGRYFRATDTESLQSIYNLINQLETTKQEQATIRPQKEYYPWFAGLAVLLSFYWLLRKLNWTRSFL